MGFSLKKFLKGALPVLAKVGEMAVNTLLPGVGPVITGMVKQVAGMASTGGAQARRAVQSIQTQTGGMTPSALSGRPAPSQRAGPPSSAGSAGLAALVPIALMMFK